MARFIIDRQKASGKIPGSLIHLGKKKIDQPIIRLISFNETESHESTEKTLDDCVKTFSDENVSWISIYGLHDPNVIQRLGEVFNIHSLLLEDMLNTDQRPKIAETEDQLIVILKTLDYDPQSKKLSSDQISMILDENYLVTIQEKENHYFDAIRERISKGTGRVRRKSADYLTYLILDTIMDNYLLNIETLGAIIEKTESGIFAARIQKGLIQEVYKHKTEINFMRKNIRPVKEILHHLLENESGFIKDDNLKYFRDLNDLVIQATETIEIYQMMLNDQMNIYHASLDSRANEIMKVLTIFSAFFIPLTFIAGVYGTNFDYLPEIHLKYGYLYFWLLMIAVTLGLVVYFRKRKWF
jgi:magnesium transporter